MSVLKTSRKFHKWLMLFLSIQFVIWSVTGAYMVIFDIDYIHGDSLVVNHQTKIDPSKMNFTLKQLLKRYPHAEQLSVAKFIERDVYLFKVEGSQLMVDASNGQLLSPLLEHDAVKVAQYYYSGSGDVKEVALIVDNPPFELSSKFLPAWRVNFDDIGSPSLYISAQSGALVTKRHEFWRLFDWMFRFHIMDYGDEEDIANDLLFWISLFGIMASLSGLMLVYYRVFKTDKRQNDSLEPTEDKIKTDGAIV